MLIDWAHFTPITSLFGGIIIGIAVAILLIFNGKIAGISGVIAPTVWQLFLTLPAIKIETHSTALIIAGLLVGFGTRLGNGCTSGHGVCGLSRFSKRSLVATMIFMALGFISTYIVRHLL